MGTAARKVAIITGASRGVGEGLVAGYRKLGYGVVATSRSIKASQDLDVVAVRGDIADPATARRVIRAGLDRFGRIDSLVNNGGAIAAKSFTEYTSAEYEAATSVNLNGFLRLTQLTVEQMLTCGGGHVVQITSSRADHASWDVASVPAALTRGGLQSATKALAIEYARRGIRSNAVALGVIRNPTRPEAYNQTLAAMHPLGRLGEIDDVVDAVLYLESASFVTGAILHVDGGQSAGH
jgi:NAD(P)-dependent dehydrogenase (short-subunit alcohol dehydrogenase family)